MLQNLIRVAPIRVLWISPELAPYSQLRDVEQPRAFATRRRPLLPARSGERTETDDRFVCLCVSIHPDSGGKFLDRVQNLRAINPFGCCLRPMFFTAGQTSQERLVCCSKFIGKEWLVLGNCQRYVLFRDGRSRVLTLAASRELAASMAFACSAVSSRSSKKSPTESSIAATSRLGQRSVASMLRA